MRYLIDTNILIFLLDDKHYLEKNVLTILYDYDNIIYTSSLSIFEITHLFQNGRITTKIKTAKKLLETIENEFNIQIIHTKNEYFETFSRLPTVRNHNDPVDRIIIAQAITEKLHLISSDSKFKEYKDLNLVYNDKNKR